MCHEKLGLKWENNDGGSEAWNIILTVVLEGALKGGGGVNF